MLRMSNIADLRASDAHGLQAILHGLQATHAIDSTFFTTGHLAASRVAHECGLAIGRSLPMPASPPPLCQVNNMVLVRCKYEYLEGLSESSDVSKALRSTGQQAENIGKKIKTK